MRRFAIAATVLVLATMPSHAQDANRSAATSQCTAAFEQGWLRAGGYLYTRMTISSDTAALPDMQVPGRVSERYARAAGYSTSISVVPLSASDRSLNITWKAIVNFNLSGFQMYDAQTRNWSATGAQHIICLADVRLGKFSIDGISVRLATGIASFSRPAPGSFPR